MIFLSYLIYITINAHRLSHAVLPLFTCVIQHFRMRFARGLYVILLHVTCEKPNISHVIRTGFKCESHMILQYITCGVRGYFTCNTHVNRMRFTCENTCFHMWIIIFAYFHMWKPLFITCGSHAIRMWNIRNYMWQISPVHMWTLGFHMWWRFFHM